MYSSSRPVDDYSFGNKIGSGNILYIQNLYEKYSTSTHARVNLVDKLAQVKDYRCFRVVKARSTANYTDVGVASPRYYD